MKTSVYKSTTDSECERTNCSIIRAFRKFVHDNPKYWSRNLCYVINT